MKNAWNGEFEQVKQVVTWCVTIVSGTITGLFGIGIANGQTIHWDSGTRLLCLTLVASFMFMVVKFVVGRLTTTAQHRAHRRELWRMWWTEQSAESKWKSGAVAELSRKREESDVAGKQEELRQYQVQMARKEVVAFYYRNAFLLADDCPVPLFRSMIEAQVSLHMTAEDAWKGSRDTINALKPMVAVARQRQLKEEYERQQELHRRKQENQRRSREAEVLGKELKELRTRLYVVAKSPAGQDINELELAAIKRRMVELREQQAAVLRGA